MTLGNDVIYDGKWRIKDLRALRRDRIGFIFQAPYLIPFLNVTDNVALLPMLAGHSDGESRTRAGELLEALDVAQGIRHALPAFGGTAGSHSRGPGEQTGDPGRRAHGTPGQRAGCR